jgi:hypothetical protein
LGLAASAHRSPFHCSIRVAGGELLWSPLLPTATQLDDVGHDTD